MQKPLASDCRIICAKHAALWVAQIDFVMIFSTEFVPKACTAKAKFKRGAELSAVLK
jgi:hypothetical protein